MSPYYPPKGGGGGSGTPGGSDSQVQINSQNAFAGFANLRWVSSSNSLDLNTAGRVRHGGVAEVDGVAPTGVTGLIWLDTSASSFTSSSAGLTGSGGLFVVTSASPLLPNSRILTAGSSVTVVTDTTSIYITALTGGILEREILFYRQVGVGAGTSKILDGSPGFGYAANHILGDLSNTVFAINTAWCIPFFCVRSMAIDTMCCRVVTAGSATTQIQLGIYSNNSDTDYFPNAAISTSGFLSGSNAAIMAFNPAQTLSSNTLYWFVYQVVNSSVNIRSVLTAGCYPIFGVNFNVGGTFASNYGIQIAVTGTLPSVMPQSGNSIVNTLVPALIVRKSI